MAGGQSRTLGVRFARHPLAGNYCGTLDHSVRLAIMTSQQNVGAIFNTCHLLKVEGEVGWDEKLLNALSHLYLISVNVADRGNTKKMNWNRLIRPLGEGSFDTDKLVKMAKDNC
jgi:sugar phosphate isomerase/epimerase